MSIGRREAEFHPTKKVLRIPMGYTVRSRCSACAWMRAAGIWGSSHGVTLIEMGVRVDQKWPNMPAIEGD
jgi:hypothetical protein